MKAIFNYLGMMPKTAIFLIGLMLVVALGAIDYLTSYEISFSIFYLLPVVLVSWFDKKSHAVFISILSAAAWLWADVTAGHTYSHFAIPVWNAITRLGFFLLAVFSLSEINKLLLKEQTLARIDSLTGAANRRAFYEIAKREIDRAARFSRPITLAYIDIDDFKQVNDTHGHSEGDTLLRSIARTLTDNIRSIDLVSRLGGDEFAILLTETDQENAKTALNNVQAELLRTVKNNHWPVTFSIGTVTCYKSCNLDELIKEADNLMYSVKRSGKNRIEHKNYEPPTSNAV